MIPHQTAIYALRAMAALALLEDGKRLRSLELAGRTGIPTHYLSKVMRKLVVAGLVDGLKGHGGGFRLNRPAAEIRFRDILLATEFDPEEKVCAFGWPACDELRPCPLHSSWSRFKSCLIDWADQTTLDEVANSGESYFHHQPFGESRLYMGNGPGEGPAAPDRDPAPQDPPRT